MARSLRSNWYLPTGSLRYSHLGAFANHTRSDLVPECSILLSAGTDDSPRARTAIVTAARFVSKSRLVSHCVTVRPENVGSGLWRLAVLMPIPANAAPHKSKLIELNQGRLIAELLLPPNRKLSDRRPTRRLEREVRVRIAAHR